MLRRNFLQMLGIGGAASTMLGDDFPVKQYAVQGAAFGRSVPTSLQELPLGEQLASARRDYERFTARGKASFVSSMLKEWRDEGHYTHYDHIDPDLQDMKSWSRSTKLRVHMERKAEARWHSNERYLLNHISSLLGMEKKND